MSREQNPDFHGWEELHRFTIDYSTRQAYNALMVWYTSAGPKISHLEAIVQEAYPEWRPAFVTEVVNNLEATYPEIEVQIAREHLKVLP